MVVSPTDRVMIEGFLKAAEAGKLVQSMDSLHQFLVQQGLAWKQVIHCQHIGVHEQNRDGLGCSCSHVHELLTSIATIGFSQQEVKGICVEVPSGAEGDSIRDFNEKLIGGSSGKLAPLTGIRYASIVGSHANQASRCFWFKITHEDNRLTNDGVLSLERLQSHDAAWARSIREGHEWLVISYEIAQLFPQYCLLAQASGNASGQIASVEHEMQLAKRINASIAAFLQRNPGKAVTYQDVSAEILRSRSPHAAALPSIFGFVMKCGGGTGETSFLSKTERYVRASGFPNRALGGDLWHGLSQDCKGSDQHVAWRHMCIKLGLSGPEKAISLTDIKRSLSAKEVLPNVKKAEAVLFEVQRLLHGFDNVEAVIGDLEVDMAALVLQKKKIAKHDSIEDAAGTCLGKFGLFVSSTRVADLGSLRVYDDTGKLVSNSRVVDLGFQPGKEVIRRADDMKATIIEISADKVRLKLQDGKEYEASSEAFVENKWKMYVPKIEPVLFKGWSKFSPLRSEEFSIAVIKGLVFRSMYEQYETLQVDDLDVFLKPGKNVQVKKGYNINILKLPIATAKVHVGDTVPAGAVQLAALAAGPSNKTTHLMSMQAYFQGPKTESSPGFINPVWVMKSTSDRDEANMELHWASKASSNQKLTCKSTTMILPIVRNFVKLDAGDSLVLWRPDMAKNEEIEVLQPVSKKARK
ncbi:unnamed protein product [Symbiodinium sp. CCMP2592]|nr:unnamed protein product [Symbiodinium sp. CCMP2592]